MPSSGVQTCARSEEHTSELQSHSHLVCRLLLEKKNNQLSNDPGDATRESAPLRTTSSPLARITSVEPPDRARAELCRDSPVVLFFFFFNDTAPPEIYPLSLPDALPI